MKTQYPLLRPAIWLHGFHRQRRILNDRRPDSALDTVLYHAELLIQRARGWAVRGIDVSQTALEMAQQNAAQRGLNVQFDAADICSMPEQPDRYDLVIDGHCLHCLVCDEHRREALTAIHRLLKPDGLFLIETMISHPALIVKGNYRIDPQGVLSIKVDSPTGHDDAFKSDSEWFAPYRRLLMADQVATELRNTGFVIQSQRTMEQKDPRKPMLIQIRAGQCAR
jgi:SAM-dependent methyltransferase